MAPNEGATWCPPACGSQLCAAASSLGAAPALACETSQRRFTRVRTMGCAGGWIDSRYLLPRDEYERQKYDRQREEYERQRRG